MHEQTDKPMRVIGTEVPRRDGQAKVDGSALYTADLTRPGMLHARLLLAGRPHARVRALDTSRAKRVAGVRAVITADDVPNRRYGLSIADRSLFARDVVRFEGEIVAAVAATTLEAAEAGVRAISVEFDDLEPLLDPEKNLADPSALVHPEFATYVQSRPDTSCGNDCAYVSIVNGDAQRALATAEIVVESRFATDMSHPLSIEPHAVLAEWTGNDLTVWSTSQVPFLARNGLATMLDLPLSSVRVIVPTLGGGFGGKCDFHLEAHAAALARVAGRPVRLELTREEEFVVPDMTRHPMTIELRTGLSRDGVMIARQGRIVLDTGAYASHGPNSAEIGTLMAVGPYRIPHLQIEAHTVYTHRTPAGSTRGPTAPQICWAVEQHTDEIATRLGLDPVELRQRNLLADGDLGPTGQVVDHPTAARCLDKVACEITARVRPGEHMGVSVGWWGSVPLASGATLRLNPDGSTTLVVGAQENGSGATAALPLIVAEELGIDPVRVGLLSQDTDAGSFDWGSLGSQTTLNAGRAVLAASRGLIEKIKCRGALMLGRSVEEVEFEEGAVYAAGSFVTLVEVARSALDDHLQLSSHAAPLPAEHAPVDSPMSIGRTMYAGFPYPSYYAAGVRVTVDPETGVVDVLEVVVAHDIGKVLNPLGARGQIEGGIAHSLGMALSEGTRIESGMQVRPGLVDYLVSTASDIPALTVHFVAPSVPPSGPYGSRSVGEAAVIPTAAAIGNAVSAAIGAPLRQLPMTPQRIWRTARQPR